MRYALTVEVKLIEIEEPPAAPSTTLGQDAVDQMAHGVISTLAAFSPQRAFMQMPGGLELRKTAIIGIGSFEGITGILERYYQLTKEIELERP